MKSPFSLVTPFSRSSRPKPSGVTFSGPFADSDRSSSKKKYKLFGNGQASSSGQSSSKYKMSTSNTGVGSSLSRTKTPRSAASSTAPKSCVIAGKPILALIILNAKIYVGLTVAVL